jgi:hypothetical protein
VAAVAREKQRAEQRASLIAEIQKGLDCGTAGPLGIDEVFCRGRRRIAPRERPRRTYKTGRNQQINFKATAATIERFYRIADEKKLPLCETLELALDALGQLPR